MFSALSDFNSAIVEVDILIRYASRNSRNIDKYATFNKSALILLCSKFEAFIEEFLEEYSYECCQICNNKTVDSILFNHLLEVQINQLEKVRNNLTKRLPILRNISLLVETNTNSLSGFKVDSKFSFGKHGQKELTKLLTKFGFKAFNDQKISEDFYRKFNSLFNIRNNIIHEDATPSLTHQDVKDYKNLLQSFCNDLVLDGETKINSI